MDIAPWHAQQSFLAAGWHQNKSYSTVLPNLQRIPNKEVLPELSSYSFKNIKPRPYSAEACRKRRTDPAAEPFCRIQPLPLNNGQPQRRSSKGHIVDEGAVVEVVDSPFVESAYGDEAKLLRVIASSPQVATVRLTAHRWLSPQFLVNLGQYLPNLKELCLRATQTTDAVVSAVAIGCPELRVLDLGECAMLQNISSVASLSELRELRVPRCIHAVTSEFVGRLHVVKRLEVLDLSFNPLLGNEGLQRLATGCRYLKWLDLSGCQSVGDEGVFALVSNNTGITHLALALNSEQLTDCNMAESIRCLKRLQHIDLSGCPQLCQQSPLAVARFCEYVNDVSFAGSAELSDDALRPLFSRCLQLQRLDISGCQCISGELLLECLPWAHELQKLVLNSLPDVSEDQLARLQKQYTNCVFERCVSKYADPNDVSSFLRLPPGAALVVKSVKKERPNMASIQKRNEKERGKGKATKSAKTKGVK